MNKEFNFILETVACILFMIGVTSYARTAVEERAKPNIIYVLADDLGYGDVSAYNKNSQIQTSNIDQLTSEGVMFTDAHTSSSVCTPTRYGILTGRYNWRTTLKQGVLSGYSKSMIEQERTTVAELLRQNGYHTAFIGKWHLGWDWAIEQQDTLSLDHLKARPVVDFTKPIQNGPNSHGFDYSYGFSGSLDMPPYVWVENGMPSMVPAGMTVGKRRQATWREGVTAKDFTHEEALPEITRRTVRYINENAHQEKPFFLYMALPAPHTPILPTPEFQGSSGLENPYGDFVVMVDWVVGEVTKALEENGVDENTLIIFTSDNGCSPAADMEQLQSKGHSPSHVYRGTKSDIFEGGHRVPYIMTWKGTTVSSTSNQLVCTTDLFATVADLVGATISESDAEDSYSHLQAAGLKSKQPRRTSVVHHSLHGEFAYRKGDWKVNFTPGSGGWSYPNRNIGKAKYEALPEVQLYHMKDDAAEQHNLAAEFPNLVAQYQTELLDIIQKGRSTTGPKQTNDQVDAWPQWEKIKASKKEED